MHTNDVHVHCGFTLCSAELNTIVILDEFGASPEGVTLKEVVML